MTTSGKGTGKAHPNKAIVIYWGKKDPELFIPTRPSLSLTIDGVNKPLEYTTTIELSEKYERDSVFVDGKERKDEVRDEFIRHLDILRGLTGHKTKTKISVHSTFPVGAGIAGSAARSGSIALAYMSAVGMGIDMNTASRFARHGSGSGCRLHGGWNHWYGNTDETSYARQIFDEHFWDVRNLIVIIDTRMKKVPSRAGMQTTLETCDKDLYNAFVNISSRHIKQAKKAIKKRDINLLGAVYENENLLFRNVCLETNPRLDYWNFTTYKILGAVSELQREGVSVFGGTDAGPQVHVLTLPDYVNRVLKILKYVEGVKEVIHCKSGESAYVSQEHLF